jgi:hypothetical protein
MKSHPPLPKREEMKNRCLLLYFFFTLKFPTFLFSFFELLSKGERGEEAAHGEEEDGRVSCYTCPGLQERSRSSSEI